MAHGDNRGLKLPPKVAPIQVVIVPIAQHKEGVLNKANEIFEGLKNDFRVKLDDRDNYSTGFKFNDWEMRGVPIRIEMGPRDIENGVAVLVRRDTCEKETVEISKLNERIKVLLEEIHTNMFNECLKNRDARTTVAHSLDEILENLNTNQGYVKTMWCERVECENKVKEVTGAHSRCIPFEQEILDIKCAICGKPAKKMIVWGRQY
jgi:prolyl-tRNA synthetase